MFSRFANIVNYLIALAQEISKVEFVNKILSFTSKKLGTECDNYRGSKRVNYTKARTTHRIITATTMKMRKFFYHKNSNDI